MRKIENLARSVRQALGSEDADCVIKNARVYHLADGSVEAGDIAIGSGRIVGVGKGYRGREEFDANGLFAVPGFVDSHCHIESSLLVPYEFERCVLPRGTTSAICDPHELANVVGIGALEYFTRCAENMAMNLQVRVSSCVPATALETSGGAISPADISGYLRRHPGARLAEMMNFPGVLGGDPDTLAKLAASPLPADGHAPLLSGRELCAYLSCGIANDHESSSLSEAREKLRRGMAVLIREGSAARDLDELSSLITVENSPFIAFCTDDRDPEDILQHGHIDFMVRRAIGLGAPPLAVYRAASWSAARIAGLENTGLIAPGYEADIVLVDDLKSCGVRRVFKSGRPVDEAMFQSRPGAPDVSGFTDSVRLKAVDASDFQVRSRTAATTAILAHPGSLITDKISLQLPVDNGIRQTSVELNAAKLAVLERHGRNGNIAKAFIRGFKMRRGALASSVAHDSHNVCVVGMDDADMALAVDCIVRMHGGFAVASGGRVLAEMPLPAGGLTSLKSAGEVATELEKLSRAARELCDIDQPFQLLSFMALPVIPHLKLTDRGLVDVDEFAIISPGEAE